MKKFILFAAIAFPMFSQAATLVCRDGNGRIKATSEIELSKCNVKAVNQDGFVTRLFCSKNGKFNMWTQQISVSRQANGLTTFADRVYNVTGRLDVVEPLDKEDVVQNVRCSIE